MPYGPSQKNIRQLKFLEFIKITDCSVGSNIGFGVVFEENLEFIDASWLEGPQITARMPTFKEAE